MFEDKRTVVNENLTNFIRHRFDTAASQSLLDQVTQIPLEVHPLHKTLCLSFRIVFFCNSVVERSRHLPDKIDWEAFRQRTSGYGDGQETKPQWINLMDIDFGLQVWDFGNWRVAELIHINLLRSSSKDWPLLERAALAEDWRSELAVGESSVGGEVLENIKTLCVSQLQRAACQQMPRSLTRISADEIRYLTEDQDQFRIFSVAYRFVYGEVGTLQIEDAFKLHNIPRENQIMLDRFINERRRAINGECSVCYSDNNLIEWCPAKESFSGHLMCEDCTIKWYAQKNLFSCPTCRRDCSKSEAVKLFGFLRLF